MDNDTGVNKFNWQFILSIKERCETCVFAMKTSAWDFAE